MRSERASAAEPRRLSSMAEIIGHHVTDLTQVATGAEPEWLRQLEVPEGWQTARIDSDAAQPTRMAVCGVRPDSGWYGCETITVLAFSGTVPDGVVREYAESTLRNIGAQGTTSTELPVPRQSGVDAVRSSGYFTAGGRRMWTQITTYVAGSDGPGQGVLVEHVVFVDALVRARLRDDITELGDAVHEAFVAITNTMDDDDPTSPLPILEAHDDGT